MQASFRSFVALELQKPSLQPPASTKQGTKSTAGDMHCLVVALEAVCAMKTALVTIMRDTAEAVITSASASNIQDGKAESTEQKGRVNVGGVTDPESGNGADAPVSAEEQGGDVKEQAERMHENQVQEIVAGFESSLVTIVLNASPAQLPGKA